MTFLQTQQIFCFPRWGRRHSRSILHRRSNQTEPEPREYVGYQADIVEWHRIRRIPNDLLPILQNLFCSNTASFDALFRAQNEFGCAICKRPVGSYFDIFRHLRLRHAPQLPPDQAAQYGPAQFQTLHWPNIVKPTNPKFLSWSAYEDTHSSKLFVQQYGKVTFKLNSK